MITGFYIDNFKSLVDFRLPPQPDSLGLFTCLVGLNGAGKTTILQAFDFLGQLACGNVGAWLKQREWKATDLTSRFLRPRKLIQFQLELDAPGIGQIVWIGAFNPIEGRCTSEAVTVAGVGHVLLIKDGQLVVSGHDGKPSLTFPVHAMAYQGSTLSFVEARDVHPAIAVLEQATANLRSLDLLSPQSMRRRAKAAGDIGSGGEGLGAFIHGLSPEAKSALTLNLKRFYPQVSEISTKALRAGWKDLRIVEHLREGTLSSLETDSRHVNDGLLRVLAVLSQVGIGDWEQGQACVLFDEIENGINPELIEQLVKTLLESERQVIVTTHSPLVLNYLPDEVAKASVLFIYRNVMGYTRAVRLFDLPSAQKKLALLGPGEVFVDMDLTALPAEASEREQKAAVS